MISTLTSAVTSFRASSDPVRTKELAAIHVARRNLALTEDSYRGLVGRFTKRRTESAGDMTPAERKDLIEYFRSIGFKPAKKKADGRRADRRPQAAKLRALWYALYELGVVHDPDQSALDAFVCRHTGIEVLHWNFDSHLAKAIDCLRGWCGRVGWDAKPYRQDGPCPQQGSYRPGLILAQWKRLQEMGSPAPTLIVWMRGIGIHADRAAMLTDEQADQVIKALGVFLRAREGGGDG